MRSRYSPVVVQTLGGAPQRDFEYEKKLEEYKEAKEHMTSLKKVIDNFPSKLDGFKQVLDTIGTTSEFIFQKSNKECYQFMHNISSAHRALSEKLNLLFTQFTQIKNGSNIWIKELNDVTNKCNLREECRKKYNHYEKKLYELNEDRRKEIKKNKKVGESDHERFIRNIGKFQKSGRDLIFASNSAFKSIEQFMNNRYDRIIMTMVSFIEAERAFYNEANHIMNFFNNIRNHAFNLKKSYAKVNTNYDASLYIRGRTILNMTVEQIFSPNYTIEPPPNYQGPQGQQGQPGQGNNSNNNQNKNSHAIINPFTADNNDFGNNNMNNNMNNNNNNYGNNPYNQGGFQNKSTRDTFAMNNPYNTQSNLYSGNNNNNNNFSRTKSFPNNNNFNNNNINNSYTPKDGYNPFKTNNNDNNNNNFGSNPYGGGNNFNNNNNNNQDNFWGNNNNNNNNINQDQNNNNNNNDNDNNDDDFNF